MKLPESTDTVRSRGRIGAVAERVHSAASAVADTVRAYRTAVRERGPWC